VDQEWIIRRRRIGEQDLLLIRRLISAEGQLGRSHLSNRLCEIWDWRQANGRFRQIACRDLLRQLERKGLVKLPPLLHAARQAGYQNVVTTGDLLDQVPLEGSLALLRQDLQVSLVQGAAQARLFKGVVGAYHYLGYQQAQGAQLKYWATYGDRPVACLSFGPAALRVAARDQFIGWSPQQRQERLPWVVNNDRFVRLPWVDVPGLASFVLSRCLRRLRSDWRRVYQQDLALAETFIQKDRFTGCCYAAANWTRIGESCGRGRNDRFHQEALPIKTIWVYALRPEFRQVLCHPV
jgi:uncharacterized protein DUF4338